MKVLIVEDDPASRAFLKDTVESLGYETRVAEDGLIGLQAFKEFGPDLVLSDIKMPNMDGLELLREIRKLNSNTIIVMNTAFGCEEFAIKALRLRANNYLNKPIRHAELLPLLRKYALTVQKQTHLDIAQKKEVDFSMTMENNIEAIPDVVDRLIQKTGNALSENDRLDVRLGLMELLTNAIEHGNLEITFEDCFEALNKGIEGLNKLHQKRLTNPALAKRRVTVKYKLCDTVCEWVIADEGKGFDWRKFLKQSQTGNFLDNVEGKGIFISQFHFDKLEYTGNGNTVRATKQRKS